MVQKLFLFRQMAGGCQLTGLTGPDLVEHSLLICLPHWEPTTWLTKSVGSSSEPSGRGTCSEEAVLVFCPPASLQHTSFSLSARTDISWPHGHRALGCFVHDDLIPSCFSISRCSSMASCYHKWKILEETNSLACLLSETTSLVIFAWRFLSCRPCSSQAPSCFPRPAA